MITTRRALLLLTFAACGLPAQLRTWPVLHRTWPAQPCGACGTVGVLATHDFSGEGRPDVVVVSDTGIVIWDELSSTIVRSFGPIAAPLPFSLAVVPDLDNDGVVELVIGARALPPRVGAALGGGTFVLSGATGAQLRLIAEKKALTGMVPRDQ